MFDIDTCDVYRVYDPILRQAFHDFLNRNIENGRARETLNEIIQKSHAENQEVQNLKPPIHVESIQSNQFVIFRLVIILTNECNLRCKYCYANYGMYEYQEKNNMTMDTLDEIITYFTKQFKSIHRIQFFGGEPSLCGTEIAFVINRFRELKEAGEIDYMPRFGMVTNGVHIPESLIKLFKESGSNFTVSLDGPESINDMLRKDISGNGSYARIRKTCSQIHGDDQYPVYIESTYTNEHMNQAISFVDLVKFYKEEYQCKIPHIVPVSIQDEDFLSVDQNLEQLLEYARELVDYTFETLQATRELNTIAILLSVIQSLTEKQFQQKICPAGVSTFSITNDKVIQPCFMYTAKEDISLGSLQTDGNALIRRAFDFDEKINNKKVLECCSQCYARNICSSCLGNFEISEGKVYQRSKVYCAFLRTLFKETILKVMEIKADSEKWEQFMALVEENHAEEV